MAVIKLKVLRLACLKYVTVVDFLTKAVHNNQHRTQRGTEKHVSHKLVLLMEVLFFSDSPASVEPFLHKVIHKYSTDEYINTVFMQEVVSTDT